MAYKQNWNPDEKPAEKEMIAFIMKKLPDLVDTAFLAVGASDDGGRHICAMAEWDFGETPWKKDWYKNPLSTRGWRVIAMTVPTGYLEVFFNTDGSKRVTKEKDESW